MRYTRQQILSTYFSLLSALLLVTIAQHGGGHTFQIGQNKTGASIAASVVWEGHLAAPDSFEGRIARRLQRRLYARGMQSPSLSRLAAGIAKRQKLLKAKTTVSFLHADETEFHTWDVSLQRYPLWVKPSITIHDATFVVSKDQVIRTIEEEIDPLVVKPEDVSIDAIVEEEDVTRVTTSGVAKAGELLHADDASRLISDALESGNQEVTVTLDHRNGILVNATGEDLGDLDHIATGRSNFRGSTWSRSYNVRKALREHVNNILVAPGEEFSFNDTLNGRVTLGNGWVMANVIINGDELELQPGGGICQASTTVYRAILNAGFPVKERRSHSLYVSYYKKHGVGIDATIYPGTQDLVFVNDTENHLLIQSYDDGYDAYVSMYGTSDGRKVELEGPYFSNNAPESLRVNGRKIAVNEIVWIQKVSHKDGREEENIIVSRYKELPYSAKYAYLH